MIATPIDILYRHPIRKGRKRKDAFRSDVSAYAQSLGYEVKLEKGSFGSRNIVIGNPDGARYLVTAHYDTPAAMIVPNLITPCNFCTFLLYQMLVTALVFMPMIALYLLMRYLGSDHGLAWTFSYILLWLELMLMMVGPANRSNANDNTSGLVTVLEIAASLPENLRDKVCFVLFDLEEAGLIGSASYRKAHKKASQNQIVLNLDCVGEGDTIMLFPSKKIKKDAKLLKWLRKAEKACGEKQVAVRSRGFAVYPSDQGNFPLGIGICALKKWKFGLYLGRIHTRRDTVLEFTNVNILRACLISLISSPVE